MSKIGFKQSRRSPEDYFAWRVERAKPAVAHVERFQKLKGAKVLDIGCGYGSLCKVLLDHGADTTGIEVDIKKLAAAERFLRGRKKLRLLNVQNEKLPFPASSFDVVFLFDVIEHVNRPEITITECNRVLKLGGILYVEFTPYYSITGHHLYDFAKWPIHILPKHIIKRIVYTKKVKSFLTADDYWLQFESLNKLRISQFQNMVKSFHTLQERFIIKYPEMFEIDIPLLNLLGPLKDIFTMSFEGMYSRS